MLKNKKLTFIGGGSMGTAILKGILDAKLVIGSSVTVSELFAPRRAELADQFGVAVTDNSKSAVVGADIIVLAVTPQVLPKVLVELGGVIKPSQLVISIVGGFALGDIEAKLPGIPVVRVMPNAPASVGAGMAGIVRGQAATQEQVDLVANVFRSFGQAIVVHEELLEAVTALSGCGPAYVAVLIDAMADAGVRLGLTRKDAITLAAATFWGSGKMVLDSGLHPAQLRDMVCSPGGITIAGVATMEETGVRGGFIRAIVSAYERSEEMTKDSK